LENRLLLANEIFHHLTDFVVFGTESVQIDQGLTVHAGLVGSNGDVSLDKSSHVVGLRAGGKLEIKKLSSVHGNIVANQETKIDKESVVHGDIDAGENLTVEVGTAIHGDVTAAGAVILKVGATVNGNIVEFGDPDTLAPTLLPAPLVTEADFAGQHNGITTGQHVTTTLGPGRYGRLQLGKNNILQLSAGSYFFHEISADKELELRLDVSQGAIDIFVLGDVNFGQGLSIFVNGTGFTDADPSLAKKVYLETLGKWTLDKDGQWFGTVLARNEIQLAKNAAFTGALYSRIKVQIDKEAMGRLVVAERFLPPGVSAYLVNDTGESESDHVTRDPAVAGTVIDCNGIASLRGGFDAAVLEDFFHVPFDPFDGSFQIDASLLQSLGIDLADGAHTLHLLAVDNYGNASGIYDVSFTLDTAPPTVSISSPAAQQVTNNNVTHSGQATDAVSGIVSFEARLDAGTFTAIPLDSVGNFSFPTALPLDGSADGIHELCFRATDRAGNVADACAPRFTLDTQPPTAIAPTGTFEMSFSFFDVLYSEVMAGSAFVATNYQLVVLSGPDAGQTIPVELAALDLSSVRVVLDSPLASASYEFILGPAITDLAGNPMAAPLSFPFTIVSDTESPVIEASLANDTAPGNATNTDGITADPTVTGFVRDQSQVVIFRAGFDSAPAASFLDIYTDLRPDGTFTLSRALLEEVNGGPVADGPHVLHFYAADDHGNTSSFFDVFFTLDTVSPTQPSLALSAGSDTEPVGDGQTTADRVALVGQTDPTSLVTLLSTGVATTSSNLGTFQFSNVLLGVGDNEFTVRAEDVAGNAAQFATVITRLAGDAGSDVVIDWNRTVLEAIRLDASVPPVASRNLAMVHAAVYDSVNAIEGVSGHYVSVFAPAGASLVAAAAAAAHQVLTHVYPAQGATFDAALVASLAEVPDGVGQADGLAVGRAVADRIIALRINDGSRDFVNYISGFGPGNWQLTPPMYAPALVPQWAKLEPFAMTSPAQFRPDGPASLDSVQYAAEFNQVKDLGRSDSAIRTAEQTEIARFWADNPGTYTPPGHWNQIAASVASAQGGSLSANARLFAMLNIALADAAIAAWDAKYSYQYWRPVTAIRQAADDGNNATMPDSTWSSLLVTPNFPEYVSGHSTFSGAADAVLTSFFGNDVAFTDTSLGLPLVSRTFQNFTQAADEAGVSRIFGGIHFASANFDGLATGRSLGNYVVQVFSGVDTQPPRITIVSPKPDVVSNQNITLVGRVTDTVSGVASLTIQLDDAAPVTVNFNSDGDFMLPLAMPLDGSADGPHRVQLNATDVLGNRSELDFSFTLDTAAPVLTLSSPTAGADLSAGGLLIGFADPTGSSIVQLSYAFDGGPIMPVAFDPATGAFNNALNLGGLATGTHRLTVSALDAAGNRSSMDVDFELPLLPPLVLVDFQPLNGAVDVGVTFRPKINFSRPIDPASLTNDSFYASFSGGRLPATIAPANDGTFAWLFLAEPMPGASMIQLTLDGSSIRAPDGTLLDADGDGSPGGVFTLRFSTVSSAGLPGTSLFGIVADPGPDLVPGTIDDLRAGFDGILMTPDDVFLYPIAGARVHVIGLESQGVVTGMDGSFSLGSVPAGNVKLVIDGTTATNAPPGVYFPEMVMDLSIEAGQANSVMGSMGTRDEQAAAENLPGVYLPRIRTAILEDVNPAGVTTIGVSPESAPNLTAQQRQLLTIEVPPGSLIGPDGQQLSSGQIGISTVPAELVRDMLPPGVLQHTFDITVQAPGISNLSAPAPMTFPNVFDAAPGSQLNFLSFDHTTGRLVIEGTATVSPDGRSARTDPGTGITHPGWHGVTPPGTCGGSGGLPPLPPPPPSTTIHPPIVGRTILEDTITLDDQVSPHFPRLTWTAPPPVAGPSANFLPPGCLVPQRSNQQFQPYLAVSIEIDGALNQFMRRTGSLDLVSQAFLLPAGSGQRKTFEALPRTYREMFGFNGYQELTRDQLYGAKVKVTEVQRMADGTFKSDIYTYLIYRWVDALEPISSLGLRNRALFFRTNVNFGPREKNVDLFLPVGVQTDFVDSDPEFDFPSAGGGVATWTFDPTTEGAKSTTVTISAQFNVGSQPFNRVVGTLRAEATATASTIISVNVPGYMAELDRVIKALEGLPGVDGQNGIVGVDDDLNGVTDDISELGYPGSDDEVRYCFGIVRCRYFVASGRFRTLVQGVLPWQNPSAAALDAFLNAEAVALVNEVRNDFDVLNPEPQVGYRIVGSPVGDVVVEWKDLNFYGEAEADASVSGDLIAPSNRSASRVAKQWLLAEGLNNSVTNAAWIPVAINIGARLTPPTSFAQFVANSISHEIAHTFGLKDAYVNSDEDGGTARCRLGNCIPYDMMKNGSIFDPNLSFADYNTDLLRAAVGIQPNMDTPLTRALVQYQNTFNLPDDVNGIRAAAQTDAVSPEIGLEGPSSEFFFGGEDDALGAVAADGPGNSSISIDYVVHNMGLAPLTINHLALMDGTGGFSLVDTGLIGHPIPVQGTATLTIHFDPAVVGSAMDTLQIVSDAGASPNFELVLTATGLPPVPAALAQIVSTNNLGGVPVDGGTSVISQLARVTNNGTQPLRIIDVRIVEGNGRFRLLGFPTDTQNQPIELALGESISFGIEFDPDVVGLHRSLIDIVTNDPENPILRMSAVGTGLPSVVYPDWGNDFVALDTRDLPGSVTLRTVTDDLGNFQLFIPQRQFYHFTAFDPVSGLISHSFGNSPLAGQGVDLTATLIFAASTVPDSDFDGLPDDVEHTIGTSIDDTDSDSDGLSDFVEVIQLGLDPLGTRPIAAGVVAAVSLQGEAKEVVVEGSIIGQFAQTAYVATGPFGLAVVDVSEFSRPIVLSQLVLAGDARDIAVDSGLGLAAVAAAGGGLHVVNVTDPTAPRLVRSIAATVNQVEVVEGTAYAAVGPELRAYDLLTGDLLQTLIPGASPLTGLAREGQFLYTMDEGNSLRAFEISDGGSLVARGALTLPDGGGKLFVGSGIAYAVAANNPQGGFAAADVSDPQSISLLSGSDVIAPDAAPRTAIAANGSGLAVLVGAATGPSLDLLSVVDPADTNQRQTRQPLPVAPSGLALAGGIAFLASGNAGLQVVNYLNFDNRNQPPTVTIATPVADIDPDAPGVQVLEGTTIPVRAVVTDDVQIRNVELLVNGQVVRNDVSFPFDLSAMAPRFSPSSRSATLQVRVTDTGGNSALSNTLTFDLVADTVAPMIVSIEPPDGANRTGIVQRVEVRFSESMGPDTVNADTFQLFDATNNAVTPLGLVLRGDDRTVSLAYSPLSEGSYRLMISAAAVTDRVGNPLGATDIVSQFTIGTGTIRWVNPAGGFWDDPANWDLNRLPNQDDDVVINVPATVTIIHRQDTTVINSLQSNEAMVLSGGSLSIATTAVINNSFTLNFGTLTGAGDVTVNGLLSWNGGTVGVMSGSGRTIAAGGLEISSGALDGRRLENAQTATWLTSGGDIFIQGGAVITNLAGATFDVQSDRELRVTPQSTGQEAFINAGTVRKSAGAPLGRTRISVPLTNNGTFEVQAGLVQLTGGGGNGTFTVAADAKLEFLGNTYNLDALSNVHGAGTMQVSGGTVNVFGGYSVSGTTAITGGTVNFNSPFDIPGHVIGGGTTNFNSPGSLNSVELNGTAAFNADVSVNTIALDLGVITGSGALTVTNQLNWTFGTMTGTGTTAIAVGATLIIRGGGIANTSLSRTLTSAGTLIWTGTGRLAGQGSTVLQSSGVVDVRDGSFSLVGFSASISGEVRVAGGALISFDSGSYTFNSGAGFTGAGLARLTGGTGTISADANVSAQNFELTGGTLSGDGDFNVVGSLIWSGGTMSGLGSTIIAAVGTLTISVSSGKTLSQRTLINAGTANWTGTGTVSARDGAAIINQAGALFDVQANASLLQPSGVATFSNAGTLRRSAGTGTFAIAVGFHTTGSVEIEMGTVSFAGGGTGSGAFQVAGGAVAAFTSNTFTLTAGASFTGAGLARVAGATAIVTIPGGTGATAQNFELINGTLSGEGDLTVNGSLSWSGGTMSGNGSTTVAASGTLTISGSVGKNLSQRAFVNAGTATWAGTGTVSARNGAVITNQVGAVFDVQANATLSQPEGVATFTNAGTFRRSAGTATFTIAVGFVTSGNVDVQTGTLSVAGGGTGSGAFQIAAGAVAAFTSNTFTLTAGASFTGAGSARVAGATAMLSITAGTDVIAQNFELASGTLTGNGSLTVSGTVAWTGGTMSGTGSTTIDAGGTLTISGSVAKTLSQRSLINRGTVIWTGTGSLLASNGAAIANQTGALFDVQTGSSLTHSAGAQPMFTNTGTFRKSVANLTTTVNVPFNTPGLVDLQVGTLRLNSGGSAGGTIIVAAGSTLLIGGATYTFEQTALVNGAGTVQTVLGSTLNVAGGLMVEPNVLNAGTLNPAAGVAGGVSISGDFSQGTGRLNIELGGLTPGTDFDQLNVNGTATLAGTLNITLIGGFSPNAGDSFRILSYGARVGTFGTILGLDLGGGKVLVPSYNANDLTLTTAEALQLAGDSKIAGQNTQVLTEAMLQPLVTEAKHRWAAAGIDAGALSRLEEVTFQIAELPGALLGLSASWVVTIDARAAGHGWFIDPSPEEDIEFRRSGAYVAGRIDLLSVLAHELGHLLGFDHYEGDDTMAAALAPGVRRLPASAAAGDTATPDARQVAVIAPRPPSTSASLARSAQVAPAESVLRRRPKVMLDPLDPLVPSDRDSIDGKVGDKRVKRLSKAQIAAIDEVLDLGAPLNGTIPFDLLAHAPLRGADPYVRQAASSAPSE
jgi:hypothetical protein